MKINRHQTRELAFQTLFALESNQETQPQALFDELTAGQVDELPPYFTTLVTGVQQHATELNELIQTHLAAKWTVDRLNKADLIILQLAVYEIKFSEQVPRNVAINEALELTKQFSDDQATNFVNAVLDQITE
ncbi:transcription antitermination factor NusB [Fructilactobacillus myrtifloralis]|uniref:Transcription antitermination protein NusB n=1 Tax=Fructilactobacillus myrtifloralis TaxID=2940301 RepID=A0ABY5BQS8_9LACO|nr:transcription antitermination factor NusB [Fructilactobacillus myrtifloralis]USS85281.1 transcription antitermination factor NusB [Fructilactobacillus myrtifloralis]